MSDDDREPEDAQLRALRSVWLSLPDEDPPSGGLAELMAAARARAEVLAQPPWWRRLLVQLRRPPALAFATLLVVIGGAIAIGRRSDTVDSSGPITAPAAPTSGSNESSSPGSGPVPAKALPASTLSAPGDNGAPSSQGDTDKGTGGGERQDATGNAPVPPPTDGNVKAGLVSTPKVAPAVHHSTSLKRPSVAPAPVPQPALQETPDSAGAAADTARAADVELKKDEAKTPATETDSTSLAPRKAPTDDELVVQARAAAARGDCGQANAISARVGGRRSRQLAADPAIAKCATK